MKDKFYEFYKLSDEKVAEIWEKGLLIVDTNVLLDLYRLGLESRKDLKKSIDYFGDRIWLPYQTGLEFHRRRESVIKEFGGSKYDEFEKTLNLSIAALLDSFKPYKRHPCISYSYIERGIERLKKSLENRLVFWRKAYPFDVGNDEVLDWVTEKFNDKIGEDNSIKELLELYKEGEIRYKAQVPPGYKDANDAEKKGAGQRYVYGDLIIWKSVIAKAKKDKVDIIFLTNDNKEDWYEKYKGQTKGPRFELFREFHREAGQDIIIMSEAAFLKEMKEKKSVKVKDASIEDAERAISPGASFDWMKPLDLGWPLHRTIDASSLSPNTIVDLSGSLTNFEPVVYRGVTALEDYPSFLVNPKTGLIDTGYLDRIKDNPFIHLKIDDEDKKDDK